MGVIGFLVRAEVRRRWRTYGLLALLVAIVTGAAMASAAGARRTASVYDRLLLTANAEDVLVNPDDGYADFDAIEALPQVRDACRASGAMAALIGPDGAPDFATPHLPFVSDGRCLMELSAPARVTGRLPDVDEPHETFLSRQLAEDLEIGVGDVLPIYVFEDEEAPPETVELRVTGIGVYGQDALLDPENEATFPVLLLTPAFAEAHPFDLADTFTGSLVQLEGGEQALAPFNAAAAEVAGEQLHLEDRWANERKAALALEPYELAMWLFALAVTVAGGGMVLGALHRSLAGLGTDQRTLSSLGIPPGARRAVPVLVSAGVGALGVLAGIVLAVVLSPVAPIGPAHGVEPDPGLAVDGAVLLIGAVVAMVAAVGLGAMVALRLDRTPVDRRAEDVGFIGRIRLGASPATAAGIRLATGELGASRSAARSTVVGATVGVGAVLTVLVVGAGLTRVVDDPARYGWTWDAMVGVSEEDDADYLQPGGGPVYRDLVDQLDDAGVAERTAISYGQLDVGGEAVAAVGIGDHRGGVVAPAVLEGTLPTGDGEVALGATTLERIGVDVGDEVPVSFGGEERTMQIVGTATFPRLTEYPGAPNTGLGDGVLLTSAALEDLSGALPNAALLLRADDDVLASLREVLPVGDPLDIEAPAVMVERPQRPDALFGYDSTATVREVLAYLLGGLALASVALGLAAGARSARREVAVLKTIGFTSTQVRRVLHLHGLIVGAIALLVGVPLGLAGGRAAWQLFADHLGVATDPVTPTLRVVAVAVILVLLCLLLTLPQARTAARRAPAQILRAE